MTNLECMTKYYGYSINVTVKNGFPAVFWFNIGDPDESVGIFRNYITEWHFTNLRGGDIDFLKIGEDDLQKASDTAYEYMYSLLE